MTMRYFSDALCIDGEGCVGLWLQGLLGDAVLASTTFDHILRQHPDRQWVIVHSFRDPLRAKAVPELLQPFFTNGRIRAYVYHSMWQCLPMPAEVSTFFERARVAEVYDLLFDRIDRSVMSAPNLGLRRPALPKGNRAVLCRRSAWNDHFPLRNRPRDEWSRIEQAVIDAGYEATVVGVDDDMELSLGVIDRRHRLGIRELLEFTTGAALVVSCTTFIPVFTQYVCPTFVICDPQDHEGQLRHWRMTDQYRVHPATDGYLVGLVSALPVWGG